MDLDGAVKAIRTFGVTRKRTIRRSSDSFLRIPSAPLRHRRRGCRDHQFGDDYILFAADGIMILVKTDPSSQAISPFWSM